jgi:CIC family chloride channel protein
VFLPALFVGGLAGGLCAEAGRAWLGLSGSPGVLVLVGMAAVLAGTSHAPITALLLAFEMTQSYEVILPVMVAVALSTLVARALRRHSIYTEKLAARGIDLDRREDLVLRGIAVSEVMRRDPPAVRHDAPLDVVLARFLESPLDAVFVTDAEGRPVGQVTLHDVKEALAESASLGGLVVARDVCEGAARVRPEESLAAALDRLTRQGREVLAVVDESGRLLGALSLRAVTDVIAREALRGEFVGVAAAGPGGVRRQEALRLGTGVHVRALEVPAWIVGASVAALELRRRFGVSVLSVRREGVDRRVEPARALEAGDTLVVMGEVADLERFAVWLRER